MKKRETPVRRREADSVSRLNNAWILPTLRLVYSTLCEQIFFASSFSSSSSLAPFFSRSKRFERTTRAVRSFLSIH